MSMTGVEALLNGDVGAARRRPAAGAACPGGGGARRMAAITDVVGCAPPETR